MRWSSGEVFRSVAIFSATRRLKTGPRAATQPIRSPPPTRLRERVDVDHVRRARPRSARPGLAVEGERRVDAVLEDEERALAREGEQALARARARGARPVGFWQAVWSATSLTWWRASTRSSASTSRPSASVGIADHARAGRLERAEDADEGRRLDADDVVRAARRARATRSIAWRAPVVTMISSASAAKPCCRPTQRRAARAARAALDVGVGERVGAELGETSPRPRRARRPGSDSSAGRPMPSEITSGSRGRAHRLLEHAARGRRQRGRAARRLPVVVELVRGERRQRAHERAAADGGREVAELAQAAGRRARR